MLVKLLDTSLEKKYDDFLLNTSNTLFFASNKYRKLLKEFLNEEDAYFLAIDEHGSIKGVLPSFFKKNNKYGNVLNSLPFYGSNGGIIEFENNDQVRKALINEFYNFSVKNNCVASTIISSPLDTMEEFYEKNTQYTFKDSRIGQLTPLPQPSRNIDEIVMKLIDSKIRNLIRKAQKLEITVHHEEGNEYLDFLIKTHQENLAAIGGLAKPEQFFRLIPKYFNYGSDYKIYFAKKDGQLIAALLVFYFNKTVEYYTPVIKAEFRNSQPLCLLIFEAMKNAALNGYKWWNWGGTWATQDGVYHFKKQWGTKDMPYYYYTKIYDDAILNKTKEELLKSYPYFYIAPFDRILASSK